MLPNSIHKFFILICRSFPARTFLLCNQHMFLCARCTGIYLGFFTGLIYQIVIGKRRSDLPLGNILLTSLGIILLMIVQIIVVPRYFPELDNNHLRFLTGLFCGGSVSILLFPIFNYFVLKKNINKSVIDNWRDYALLLLILTALFALHFVPYSLIFYLLSYTSVAGVIITYIIINILLASLAINWKEKKKNFNSILFLCLTAFLFVSIEIILLCLNPLRM